MPINLKEVSAEDQAEIIEEAFLPPRHSKHGKRNKDIPEGEVIQLKGRKKSFLYIQIILYTFLAMIAAIIIFYYIDERNQQQNMAEYQVDPLAKFLQEQEKNEAFPEENSTGLEEQGKPIIEEPILSPLPKPAGTEAEPIVENSTVGEVEQDEESSEPRIMALHTVQPGETLYRITMKYYQSKDYLDYLAAYNGIQDPTKDIKVGMTIKIPEKP